MWPLLVLAPSHFKCSWREIRGTLTSKKINILLELIFNFFCTFRKSQRSFEQCKKVQIFFQKYYFVLKSQNDNFSSEAFKMGLREYISRMFLFYFWIYTPMTDSTPPHIFLLLSLLFSFLHMQCVHALGK